jgi:phospholipase C
MLFRDRLLRSTSASLAAAGLLFQTTYAVAATPPVVESGAPSSAVVSQYASDLAHQPVLTHAQKLALLQQKVKYVFVLFQENRSFDQHFGTFPVANGLFSNPPASTPGFVQPIIDTDGTETAISPFRIPASVIAAYG